MARWRLTAKHYINATRYGEPTQWVREETSRDTGRVNRKTYEVPMYLDPDDPSDQNYPGEVIVAHEKGAQRNDIIFRGKPTPDMEPLDEEAEKITEATRPEWTNPIDSLPATGGNYSEALLAMLTKQVDEAAKNQPVSASMDEFKKLQQQVAALVESNSKLHAQLAAKPRS